MSKWQPIETAPKDGTWLQHTAANGELINTSLTWAWSPNAEKEAWCGHCYGIILPHDPQPTHWKEASKV